jgi:putative pyruvate formate lyase activating enzyme
VTPPPAKPRYRTLLASGELAARVERARAALAACELCPRRCGVDRLAGGRGFCRTARRAMVSSAVPHLGEEPCISGRRGSGTIFFTYCNLACSFCQNHDISHEGKGEELGPEELAACMLALARRGCHNINLVTPSHVGPQILEALLLAAEAGLDIPLVWNSSGYDGRSTLELFDGVIDIYMPDFKYGTNEAGARVSAVRDYTDRATEAVRAMHRQVGDLVLGDDGVAASGVLVRHLVLPEDLARTRLVLELLRRELGAGIGLSLMSQYRPTYRAHEDPALGRGLRAAEYQEAVAAVERLGFETAYVQHLVSRHDWVPDFDQEDPFKSSRR